MRLFVFGLGYSARAAVDRLRPRLDAVWGTTRSAARLGEIAALGAEPLVFGEDIVGALGQSDHVLVSIAPDEVGDAVLRRYARNLAALRPRCLVYLSTVGVYGDHDGAWVDEGSECRPVSERSQRRLQAEAAWRQ